MNSKFRHIAEEVRREIEELLGRGGILCRVFARGKSDGSLQKKILLNPGKYSKTGKLIQDAIGVRVVLYFTEDITIVDQLLKEKYEIDSNGTNIDEITEEKFCVSRHNLIFRINNSLSEDMKRSIGISPIDTTFEVQLRSVLSEGWHEVEHDLRYKSKKHWENQKEHNRALNGLLATLETTEWSMKKIFDDLSYRHYKLENWDSMLHCKIRLKVEPKLNERIASILNKDKEVAKKLSRIDRATVINTLIKSTPRIPISLDNIVYIWNYIRMNNPDISSITPDIIITSIDNAVTKLDDDPAAAV